MQRLHGCPGIAVGPAAQVQLIAHHFAAAGGRVKPQEGDKMLAGFGEGG